MIVSVDGNLTDRTLVVKCPNPFFSYLDEENFFRWLESIAAVKSVVGTPRGLGLVLDTPLSRESIYDLVAIIRRYGIRNVGLSGLLTEEDKEWLKDEWGADFLSAFLDYSTSNT